MWFQFNENFEKFKKVMFVIFYIMLHHVSFCLWTAKESVLQADPCTWGWAELPCRSPDDLWGAPGFQQADLDPPLLPHHLQVSPSWLIDLQYTLGVGQNNWLCDYSSTRANIFQQLCGVYFRCFLNFDNQNRRESHLKIQICHRCALLH